MQIQKDDIIYFSHVLPKLNVYAFTDDDINQIVFSTYQEAYEHMKQQKESAKC